MSAVFATRQANRDGFRSTAHGGAVLGDDLDPAGLPEYRSEDVEGRREATGRDHLTPPGGSSRATGIKPVD